MTAVVSCTLAMAYWRNEAERIRVLNATGENKKRSPKGEGAFCGSTARLVLDQRRADAAMARPPSLSRNTGAVHVFFVFF